MTERLKVIALSPTRLWSLTARCSRFGIRRKPGDMWLGRSMHEGLSGL
jgi:hypothetical protein